MAVLSNLGLDPMDQNTGRGGGRPNFPAGARSLMGNDRERKRRMEGRRGRARLREKSSAAEKAKADRKSRKEWLGWETKK